MPSAEKPEIQLPLMPIRDVVIFPHMMTPFVVGRKSSVRALQAAIEGNRQLFLATQRDASIDQPRPEDIYSVGTIVNIVQSLALPDGNIKVLVEGVERAELVSLAEHQGFFRATVRPSDLAVVPGPNVDVLAHHVAHLCKQYAWPRNLNIEPMMAALPTDEPAKLADTIAANVQLPLEQKQALLEIFDPLERLARLASLLEQEARETETAAIEPLTIPASPARVYQALLDGAQFGAFTDLTAEIHPQAGGRFQLLGGQIEGRFVELVPPRRIVQAWRSASWPAGIYSIVRLDLIPDAEGTRLLLEPIGFPEGPWRHLETGWQSDYWEMLGRYLLAAAAGQR